MKKSKHYTKDQLLGFKRSKLFRELKYSLLNKIFDKELFKLTEVWVDEGSIAYFEFIPKVSLEEVKLHWMEGFSEEK